VKHISGAGIAIGAIMAVAGSAMAADMPLKAVAPVSTYDWSGMYIGGVLGGAWATNDISDPGLGILGTAVGVPAIQTTNSSGFIGGVEGGSNYQFGNLVVGWEGDITWGGINGTSISGFGAPLLPPGVLSRAITADTNWTATATSRVGIAHNNWLLYGKAGVAWAHTDYTDNWAATAGPALFSGTAERLRPVGPWEPASNGHSGTTGRSKPNTTIWTSATRPWPSTARCSPPLAAAYRFRSACRTHSTSTSSRQA
jgi:outer membrane immunogenic protein